MKRGGLQGVRAGLAGGMTSTLRTVPAAGGPGTPLLTTREVADTFNLTFAGLDQSGRGGRHGLSAFCGAAAPEVECCVSGPEAL